uniref:Uncharacterized protein n=1 Tax=Myotis myotis TaxID=51298 RepID=A0A7J7XZX5_MYOMY|nr:hypothetical protein mMyoMyo1_011484 [Myotis myotis]
MNQLPFLCSLNWIFPEVPQSPCSMPNSWSPLPFLLLMLLLLFVCFAAVSHSLSPPPARPVFERRLRRSFLECEAHVITEDVSKGGGIARGALQVKTRWYPVNSTVKLTLVLQVQYDFKKQKG